MRSDDPERDSKPVLVIEEIPAGGDNDVEPLECIAEDIPTPRHLRLFREIGRGGMGHVHAATDRNLLRHVALKRLDKEFARDPFYRRGFITEAQITGQLEHPNIVPVHELTIDGTGVPYFTMKLVQGISLGAWMGDPQRPVGKSERLEEGLGIFLKVCDALAYAHHRGVIHLDVKSDNILVADFGQVYLMDWGLARLADNLAAPGGRSQQAPVGTPAYMSPEQARGNLDEIDRRSDVFGLGAILYEIVSGDLPYGADSDIEMTLERARTGDVISIDQACAGVRVPGHLLRIVERATAPRPENRYASVIDLQRDVRAFLRGGLYLPRTVFPAGTVVIREGDVGDSAYMIVSGRCRAYRTVGSREEALSVMGPGDVFGEIALLLDEPRAATVEAVDSVTALVLDRRTLTDGLGTDAWTGALVRQLAKRFRDLEDRVQASGLTRG